MKKELLFTFSALIATTSCNIKKTDSEQIAGKKADEYHLYHV